MIFFHQVCAGADHVQVTLSGEIDMSVRDELRSVLTGAVAASRGDVDLDLRKVTLLDCSGIGELVRAHAAAARRGRLLTVSGPEGIVLRVLEVTGVWAFLAAVPVNEPTTVG